MTQLITLGWVVLFPEGSALNFKLVYTPISAPGKENWKEVIPYESEV
jgi:hypothetical protein